MRLPLTVTVPGHGPRELVVTGPDGTTPADLERVVRAHLSYDGPLTLVAGAVSGGPLPDDPTGSAARVAPAAVEVAVVAGAEAGTTWRLPAGAAAVGRAAGSAVRVLDEDVSRRHAHLDVSADGAVLVTDEGSTNGTRLEGEVLTAPRPWPAGALLAVGLLRLAVGPAEQARGVVREDGVFVRPPRLAVRRDRVRVVLPTPPQDREATRAPWLVALLPLAAGLVLARVTGSVTFLLFALLSPVVLLATWLQDRRSGRRRSRREAAAHALAVEQADARTQDAVARDRDARRAAAPDPAALLRTAVGPGPRLWERRAGDPDVLVLRVGLADQEADVDVQAPHGATADPPVVRDAPATVALQVLGVAGGRQAVLASARWLVGQAAVLHAPDDLRLVLVGGGAGLTEADWAWARHLPGAAFGTDPASVAARLREVAALVEHRCRARDPVDRPRVLLVLDGAAALRRLPAVAAVLRDGPRVGVHALCLETEQRALPEECGAVLALAGPGRALLRRAGEHDLTVLPDGVSPAWGERVARGLAPLRLGEEGGGVPTSVRLLDLLGHPGPDELVAAWARQPSSTQVLLGSGADGPVSVDLRRDGPHALVAGTTGAGKSELLQTLVASLAVVNRPDRLSFLLVDYKGGAAFRDCARLPHVVGVVTDLDAHLTARALASLRAELTRRERVLAAAGVPDLEAYEAVGLPDGPVPRLVVVVDEFAALAAELPAFVAGLVGAAQRGRSLGVHLVLATQRPSGAVSPEIRANTGLRLALRVTDEADSRDVVDVPDAAHLPRELPGRALVRTGHGRLGALQVARVGGAPPGAAARVVVHDVPWSALGHPLPEPEGAGRRGRDGAPGAGEVDSDLAALVAVVRQAAAGVPAVAPPWLPPLPDVVTLDDLLPTGARAGGTGVALGLTDLPGEQARGRLLLDLEGGGHLLVVGAARSGRTTALRTVAGALARAWSAEDVHVSVVDGGGALGALAALPHVGAVVGRDEAARLDRLVRRLLAEVDRRQALLAAGGWADVAEQRAGDPAPLPWLVLLVDRWEALTAAYDGVDGGRLLDDLLRLLREGPAAGLRAAVTADRSGLVGRLGGVVDRTLLLRLADPADAALAGLSPRDLPERLPPGRGVLAGDAVEVQVALLSPDASGPGQLASLQALASAAVAPRPGRGPLRVDPLPARVALDDLPVGSGTSVPLGVGGEDVRPVLVDLAEQGPGLLVAGPRRSGRSTTLLTLGLGLLRQGCAVVTVLPRRSPLADLPGVLGTVGPDDDLVLRELLAVEAPLVVLVDDVEALTDRAVVPVLEQLLRRGPGRGRAVVAAGATDALVGSFRGLAPEVRASRLGLLLAPQHPLEGDLVGARLTRAQLGPATAGRGLLACAGEVTPLQVAQP